MTRDRVWIVEKLIRGRWRVVVTKTDLRNLAAFRAWWQAKRVAIVVQAKYGCEVRVREWTGRRR